MDIRTGRIYKIVCSKSNDVYVGSTFNALRTRMNQHKKLDILGKYNHVIEHGWSSLKMVLISEYQVVDRKHLLMYETLWINKLNACNKTIPFQINSNVRLTAARLKNVQKKIDSLKHKTIWDEMQNSVKFNRKYSLPPRK